MSKKNIENLDLRSEEVQEILTRVPHWMIRWGSLVLLSLIFITLFISWYVKYPDIIVARGIITTQVPPEKEFALTTGKIDSLFVKDDEMVQAGQPLGLLWNTAKFQDVFYLKSIIDTIIWEGGKFKFPIEKIPILFLGEIESKYALFEDSYIDYYLDKKLRPYSNQLISNEISLLELKKRLDLLLVQKDLEKSTFYFQKKELERNKILHEKGIISDMEFEAEQIEKLEAEKNLKNLNISISQIRQDIAIAERTAKGANIEYTRQTMVLLKKVLQSFNQLKIAIQNWERKYLFTSNIDGTVAFIDYWSENQTVTEGDLVFTVIPNKKSDYIAKLNVPALNSGKIKIGQSVKMDIPNFPESEYGVIVGKVSDVSQIPDKDGQYLIDVSLPEELVTTYGKKIKFSQEMASNATIITEELRLIERFLIGFRDIFKR